MVLPLKQYALKLKPILKTDNPQKNQVPSISIRLESSRRLVGIGYEHQLLLELLLMFYYTRTFTTLTAKEDRRNARHLLLSLLWYNVGGWLFVGSVAAEHDNWLGAKV